MSGTVSSVSDTQKRKAGTVNGNPHAPKKQRLEDHGYLDITSATSRSNASKDELFLCERWHMLFDPLSDKGRRCMCSLSFARLYAYKYLGIDAGGASRFTCWLDDAGDMVQEAMHECRNARSLKPLIDLFEREHVYRRPKPLFNETDNNRLIELPAEARAFQREYLGNRAKTLLNRILGRYERPECVESAVILQSSGYGKSRLVDELAKIVTTLPMNVRSSKDDGKDAYPPADEDLRLFFQSVGSCADLKEATIRVHIFFKHLFDVVASEITTLLEMAHEDPDLNGPELPQLWRNHFRNAVRQRLFRDVVNKVQFSSRWGTNTIATAGDEAKSALRELFKHLPGVFIDHDLSNPSNGGFAYTKAGSCLNKCFNPDSLSLLIYVDEAQNIADHRFQRIGMTVYDVMLRALAEYGAFSDLFVLFISSNPMPSNPVEINMLFPRTLRHRDPFVEMPFDCHPDLAAPIQPGQLRLTDVQQLQFLARFGRPLFWTLLETLSPYSLSKVITVAAQKLISQKSWTRKDLGYLWTDEAKIAVLDVLLNLDLLSSGIASSKLVETLVARHMRTVFSVQSDNNYIHSGYPSEPILAEAALMIVSDIERDTGDRTSYLAKILKDLGGAELIDPRQRVQTLGRMLLLRAYMKAVYTEARTIWYPLGCRVSTFLKCLMAEPFHECFLGCRPDNVIEGPILKEGFKDAWIRFTHFGRAADDESMTTSMGWAAFLRGMAIVGPESQDEVDVFIPIMMNKEAGIAEWVMSGILIQFKRGVRATYKAARPIDAGHIRLFPPDAVSRQDPDGSIHFDTLAASRRPYISLVMELGPTNEPPTKVVDSQETESPCTSSRSLRPATLDVSGDEEPQGSPPCSADASATHPRYSITVKGCSDAVYACIDPKESDTYRKLLQVNVLPRSANAAFVREMKPFWSVGLPAFKWLNDPFMQGRVADSPCLVDANVVVGSSEGTEEAALNTETAAPSDALGQLSG